MIIRLEALEHHLNIVFLRINIGEVLNQLQHIAGNIRRVLGIDRDLRAGANILQRLLNSRLVQERHLFRQIQRDFVGLRKLLTAEVVGALHIALQHEEDTDRQTNTHALQKVKGNYGHQRSGKRDELVQALTPEVEDGLWVRQLITHHQKHSGKSRQRNQVQHEWNSQHAHQQQNAVNNGGKLMGCTRARIRGRTHHHRCHRQPANSGAHHVANALCAKLAVGVGDAAVHIQTIGRLNRKQGFNRRHNSDRDTGNPHV